ncbi:hypothetical protein GCM10025881_00280 [Pseudolysinimonas kribbensis]|uniref:DUF998 domain-containing protein n=1 Tax=Pseudolysinimonas kribbensis TaxID=433641 RepID=A0ABQ6K198_9MICO|nr:hypothetical protein GCM10025881_00280 [Pseudolysinimonas kribbensis]
MITVGRAIAAGVLTAVLWVATALLGTVPIGARPLGWLEQVIVPGPLARIGELPVPWPQITVGAGAVLLGALIAGAALLTRGGARLPVVWLAAAVGSLIVGAVMGVGTIIGETPRLGVSYPAADVARDLGTQAWGLVLGWAPALVAGWSRDRGPLRAAGIATGAVALVAALVTGVAAGVGGPLRFAALDAAASPPATPSPTPSPPVTFSPAPLPHNVYALASTTCPPDALVLASTGATLRSGTGTSRSRSATPPPRRAPSTAIRPSASGTRGAVRSRPPWRRAARSWTPTRARRRSLWRPTRPPSRPSDGMPAPDPVIRPSRASWCSGSTRAGAS